MGSLLSPPSSESPADGSHIYASFCSRRMPNWLESFSPADNSWRRVGAIPGIPEHHFLKGFTMVSLGDCVYVVGGRLCRKESEAVDDDPIEVELSVRSEVLRYNVVSRDWSTCASLLVPRFDFACAACDGKIYVAGGQCMLSSGRGTSAAEAYDPMQDQWDPLPNMRTLRYKCVGVTWQGRFYAVGGFAVREDSGGPAVPSLVERSSAEVFDAERGEWDLMANMWQLDVPPNQIVAVEGQQLFSSGDCLNTWKGHIDAYDGKLNIWSIVEWSLYYDLSSLLITSMEPSSSDGGGNCSCRQMMRRLYLTMAPIGTHLYFLAGYRVPGDEFQSVSIVHVFNTLATTGEDAWRTLTPVMENGDKELCAHCCVLSI